MAGVEIDCGLDVVDHVADADHLLVHVPSPPVVVPWPDRRSGARYHLWRPYRLRMGAGFCGGVRSAIDEVPGLHLAFAFDRNRPPRLAHELVAEQLLRRPGDLDP